MTTRYHYGQRADIDPDTEICSIHNVPAIPTEVLRDGTWRVLPCCDLCGNEVGEFPFVIGTTTQRMRDDAAARRAAA